MFVFHLNLVFLFVLSFHLFRCIISNSPILAVSHPFLLVLIVSFFMTSFICILSFLLYFCLFLFNYFFSVCLSIEEGVRECVREFAALKFNVLFQSIFSGFNSISNDAPYTWVLLPPPPPLLADGWIDGHKTFSLAQILSFTTARSPPVRPQVFRSYISEKLGMRWRRRLRRRRRRRCPHSRTLTEPTNYPVR